MMKVKVAFKISSKKYAASHRAPVGASSNELEEEGEGGLKDANGEEGVEDASKDEPLEGRHVGAEDAGEGHAHQQRDQNLVLTN